MMKHTKFLALTAIAFAASSAAMAESSVTLYGNLDMSVGTTKQSNTLSALGVAKSTSTTAISSGVMSESYIGFKGTEDLGGGMEAQFVLESYVAADTGSSTLANQKVSAVSQLGGGTTWNTRDEGSFWAKNAYVGLKTNFGLFRLGQMDNLGYLSAVKYNPFGSASINPTTRVFYGTDYYARAWSNALAYYIKSDGLLFGVQYAPKNDSGISSTASAGNQLGTKVTATLSYTAGPLSAALGYESNKDNLSSPGESKSWALHGSYDLGVAKLYGEYGSGKQDSTAGQDVKSTGYQLGVSVPYGQGSFLASYAAGQLKSENVIAPLALPVGTKFRDVKVLSVGYSYSLSKRTSLYGAYMDQKDSYPIAGPGGALNNLKLEEKQLSLGVRHSF